MSNESNRSESSIDRSGQRFQNPAGIFRRKTEFINVYTVWSSLEIFRSSSELSRLDQEVKQWTLTFQKN